jgi:NADH:ubiquinone oxidoreductase subunit 5 (subunit L)/multisubunit Na+/H+ antiporter MnhA subunit
MMFLGNLTLIDFPFCTGFYFKDVILEFVYIKNVQLVVTLFSGWEVFLFSLILIILFVYFLKPFNTNKFIQADVMMRS